VFTINWIGCSRSNGISVHDPPERAISLYSSLAVLTDDALAVLDDVELGHYPEYTHAYG